MKFPRRDALIGGAKLNSVPSTFVANSKLVWSPVSTMPLDFHSKASWCAFEGANLCLLPSECRTLHTQWAWSSAWAILKLMLKHCSSKRKVAVLCSSNVHQTPENKRKATKAEEDLPTSIKEKETHWLRRAVSPLRHKAVK
eukprot:1158577-Pelagomonas_calceolata.AAC.2